MGKERDGREQVQTGSDRFRQVQTGSDRFKQVRQGVGFKWVLGVTWIVEGFSFIVVLYWMMTEVCCVWLSFLLWFSLLVVSLMFPLFLLFLLFFSTSSLIDNVKRKLFFGVFREVGCWGGEALGGDVVREIGRSSQDEL